MKARLLLFALVGFVFSVQAQDITSNLEMWYKFDYKAGDAYLEDYSGNGRHISPSSDGQARDWTSMQFGSSQIGSSEQSYVYFPAGRTDNIYLANSPDGAYWTGITGGVARTFSAWIKIDSDAAEYDGKYLFSYGNPDAATGGGGYRIELKGKSVEFANAPNTNANNWCNRNVGYLDNFAQNTWHHLALVYDGSGGRQTGFTLYVDGTVVAFNPVGGAAPDYSINTVGLYPPEIGRYMIRMAVADLRFYSRALTEGDIELLMQPVVIDNPSKLETWYKFDHQSSDSYIRDYSDNNRNIAPISGSAPINDWSSMQFGTVQLDQKQQTYVDFPAGRDKSIYLSNATGNTWMGIKGTSARTLCTWYKIGDIPDFTGFPLFYYGNENSTGGGYRIELKLNAIEFANAINNGGNNWCNRNVANTNDISKNEWHHLALVYDGEGGRQTGLTLYIDGSSVPFEPVAGDSPDYAINTALSGAPRIASGFEKIALADFRFFSKALTLNEVNMVKSGGDLFTSIDLPAVKENPGQLIYRNQSIVFFSPEKITGFVIVSVYNVTGQLEQTIKAVSTGSEIDVPYQAVTQGVKIIKIQGQSLNITGKLLIK